MRVASFINSLTGKISKILSKVEKTQQTDVTTIEFEGITYIRHDAFGNPMTTAARNAAQAPFDGNLGVLPWQESQSDLTQIST